LLGDSPTRTTASETVLITGSRTLDAQVYALRLGPYFEFPFGKHWSGRLGGGQTFNNNDSSEGASFQAGGYHSVLDALPYRQLPPMQASVLAKYRLYDSPLPCPSQCEGVFANHSDEIL
jgi:hypothetical protein